jgi:dienelactone hydrolase
MTRAPQPTIARWTPRRARRIAQAALLLCAAAWAGPVLAEPPQVRPEVLDPYRFNAELNEEVAFLPITVTHPRFGVRTTEFQLTHFRPPGPGPFPLAIYHHGRGPHMEYPSRIRGGPVVGYLMRRGFAVLVPTRVGAGGLGAALSPEAIGGCDRPPTAQIDSVEAHTRAALAFAATRPWADPTRVLMTGQSVGGYTSIAVAARAIPGLIGVINFAGGVGARVGQKGGGVLCPERVTETFRVAGRTMRASSLWIYARNDIYWGTTVPRQWFAAFQEGGAPGQFVWLERADGNGHSTIASAIHLWRRHVDPFLAGLGATLPKTPDAPPATAFAPLDDVDRLPNQTQSVREGYQRFLLRDVPRVFVVSPQGWNARYGAAASVAATLADCAAAKRTDCKAYAVDDAVVWAE